MKLVLDFGNTRIKAAVYQGKEQLSLEFFSSKDEHLLKKYILQLTGIDHVGVCWGVMNADFIDFLLDNNFTFTILSETTPLPIKNLYETPKTLGKDRLSIAVATHSLYPNENILIISAGTCITYDFVNKDGEYLGGMISPGVQMRFDALNYFTNALPRIIFHQLYDEDNIPDFMQNVGKNTQDAIIYGVISGIINEINTHIANYQQKYPGLKIIISGGDGKYFEKSIKFTKFAHSNLVVLGLNEILDWNLNIE